ncbi:MAG: ankyrin repeat domain-containing protein [Candidatus Cardinium sp.]|uniref:ankyrin repeat domain-containing protein n=1 Tax=Cardinium endosymbiont of Dermatophagoides farinae TaxID=2597823 RepID=UPI00118463AE|nr:ankyrin repeat domain-containing protein [Cardinium endosymbiont of Dermatophagoides farinae]TSJ81077.1 hypothetical protein FPG78_03580 [Cardinium endosymbiont of Dermatophagoides farinae]UWW97112.1 MAG: ankyrin repeat domain-containing protein [Candidatus Cardinium sp.]
MKKYFVLLPVMVSCTELRTPNNVNSNQYDINDQGQSNKKLDASNNLDLKQTSGFTFTPEKAYKYAKRIFSYEFYSDLEPNPELIIKDYDEFKKKFEKHYAAYLDCKKSYCLNDSRWNQFFDALLDYYDDKTCTILLAYAIQERCEGIIPLLLAHGADINAKDNEGNTLLHKAVYLSNKQGATILVNNGANKNERNNDNLTPLDLANQVLERSYISRNINIIRIRMQRI